MVVGIWPGQHRQLRMGSLRMATLESGRAGYDFETRKRGISARTVEGSLAGEVRALRRATNELIQELVEMRGAVEV